MTDNNNSLGKDLDMSKLSKLLEVYFEEGSNTVVSVHPQEFFAAIFPDGMTNGDPGAWGVILCDTIRHVARAHHQMMVRMLEATDHDPGDLPSEEMMRDRIMTVLVDEMRDPNVPRIKGETVLVPKDPQDQH